MPSSPRSARGRPRSSDWSSRGRSSSSRDRARPAHRGREGHQALRDQLGACRGAPRRVAHGGRGRVLHADRSVGLRQIHAPRHARRSRSAGQRARPGRCPAGHRSRPASGRDRVPGSGPLSLAHGARERGVRPRARGLCGGAPARDRDGAPPAARPQGLRGEVPSRALRGHEAARRDRPRARHRHEDPPDGRALRRPRRADARAHGGVAPGHLAADAQDRDLRDPQPARGALPLDADRRHDGAPRADQVGARSVHGLPALDGVARARRAAREALGRDPRGVAAGDAVRVVAARGALLVALLVLWEIVGRASNPLLSVPPSAVLPALQDLLLLRSYPDLPASVLLTLREIAVAYGLAVVVGLACGFALGFNRLIGSAYGPMLAALYAVPAVVWYPSLMLFFGLDAASKIAFGFLLGFFPVTLAVLAGIRQANPHLVTVARSFGASSVTVFAKVMVPGMLFTLMGGLRTGLALAVIGVIVGEILGSKSGMGSLINHAYGLFRTADYVALVIVTLVLIVATDALASLVEHRARRWTA